MGDETPTSYNIIKTRGSPTEATTESGHHVSKEDFVIIPSPFDVSQMVTVQCADYHNEHFVYIDPLFFLELKPDDPRKFWFAMCTCGSKAVIVGGGDASQHEGHNWIMEILERSGKNVENMLVCEHYLRKLKERGHGWHQGQDGTEWR